MRDHSWSTSYPNFLDEGLETMSFRSFESLTSSKDSSEDYLKNYDIVEKPAGNVSPDVQLAICKRGRLRRRTVVLKKVPATENILSPVAAHQALCHPAILSLFSTFSAVDSDADSEDDRPTMRYLVLEHCGPYGTLYDHLPRLNLAPTSPLEESRIRGVVKTLADALTYLDKESVVHGRLIPESVYVTEDFRVKLGGFDSAIRISPGDDGESVVRLQIPKTGIEDTQYHLAPEIKAGLQYDCSSDLWSLGLLILWMLDSSRGSTSGLESIRTDSELGTLVSQLLEEIPENRIKARGVCGHPFLDPKLPVQNLDPSPPPGERRSEAARSSLRKLQDLGLDRGDQEVTVPRKQFGELTNRRPPRGVKEESVRTGCHGRFPDVGAIAGPSKQRLPSLNAAQPGRRVVSDPVHGTKDRMKFLDPIQEVEDEAGSDRKPSAGPRVRFRSKSVTAALPQFLKASGRTPIVKDSDSSDQVEDRSLESSVSILSVPEEGEVEKGMDVGMDTEELLKDFEEAFHSPPPPSILGASNERTRRVQSVIDTLVPESHSTPAADRFNAIPRHVSSSPIRVSPSEPTRHPFDDPPSNGTEMPRPRPFDTSLLPPQTHKIARGQIVVLPSRKLLVDFREGERRHGRQGIEVLTISPDGEEISVFSAPHLSSPCCLVEPFASYRLDALPKSYWKLYTAAGKLIEQIKQHIPRLVMCESDSKFTMMANSPDADIEVVFYSSEDGSRSQQSEGGRVSDRTNLVEISRQVFAATKVHGRVNKSGSKDSPLREKEGEWKKVVLVAPGGSIDAADQTSLDGYEKEGLERTEAFLAVCRIVESGLVEDGGQFHGETSGSSGSSSSVLVCKTLPVEQHDNGIPRESGSIGLTRKLGHSLTPTTSVPSLGWNKDRHGFPFEPPSLIRQPGKFETRFIPSVGWCVRYTGPSGGAGRYRMMFFDGKTLEVDVDEECVEMMDSVRDEIVRYKIRECSSKRDIMEKMRAFKEFVSMFDDDESGAE